MTGSDLIVLAPWILFGAALGAIGARLHVARSRARRHRAWRHRAPRHPEQGRPGAAS